MGEPWMGLCSGVIGGIFMLGFGLDDMPKPGAILSDQCRMFANLFMVRMLWPGEQGRRREDVDVERRTSLVPARKEGFGKLRGAGCWCWILRLECGTFQVLG